MGSGGLKNWAEVRFLLLQERIEEAGGARWEGACGLAKEYDLKGGEKPLFASIFPRFSLLLVSGLISLMI